ncbi:MAG: formylglycine-generating enzyme family protein [Leptospirillia bacterium]
MTRLMTHMRLPAAIALCLCLAGCTRSSSPPPADSPAAPLEKARMVYVPGGPFLMGSDEVDTEGRALEFGSRRPWYVDEHPRHTAYTGPFRIDLNEVTEAHYQVFIAALGNYPPPPHWSGTPKAPPDPDLPVSHVTWMDAQNYCHWRGARLPTEAEWEKAARGTDGGRYPWGDTFDPDRANVGQTGGDLTPPGHFKDSASPYGAVDMAGNVWEWVADWYEAYPGNTADSEFFGHRHKVLRGGGAGIQGGHYLLAAHTIRAAHRFFLDPRARVADAGFRCAQGLTEDGEVKDDNDQTVHGRARPAAVTHDAGNPPGM